MRLVVRDLQTIGGYALREAVRRKVLLVVVVLTLCFLALYASAPTGLPGGRQRAPAAAWAVTWRRRC